VKSPSDPPQAPEPSIVRLLRALVWLLAIVLAVISAWVVIQRFRHPLVDGEWMTGAVRDGVDRLRRGEALYAAPTSQFAAFVYPPLYFCLSSLAARVFDTATACRAVSLAATAVAAWSVFRLAITLGATRYWARIAMVLHLATYSLTILFYDLERVDALYAAMVLGGLALLLARTGARWTVAGGIVLGLAFFAKQAGLFAFGAAIVGLVLAGERRRALLAGGAGVVAATLLYAWLQRSSGGWFAYYCVRLPGAHGIKAQRLTLFFINDLPKAAAFAAGSLATIGPVARALANGRGIAEGRTWHATVFAVVLASGMAGGFMFRAHAGGWENVLVAWLPLAAIATAVAASLVEERARGLSSETLTRSLLLGAMALQLLGAMFDPNELSPNAEDAAERQRFIALVRKLEKDGPVWVSTTGAVTRPSSIHAAALYDILRAGGRAPEDLLAALEGRRFSAIFLGRVDEYDAGNAAGRELSAAIARNYFVAGRRHERDRNGMTGYDARPRWLLRPRKAQLPPMSDDALAALQRIEKGFAEMESAKTTLEEEIAPADELDARAMKESSHTP